MRYVKKAPAALKVVFIAVPVVYIMSNIIIMALMLIYYGKQQSNDHSSYPDGRKIDNNKKYNSKAEIVDTPCGPYTLAKKNYKKKKKKIRKF